MDWLQPACRGRGRPWRSPRAVGLPPVCHGRAEHQRLEPDALKGRNLQRSVAGAARGTTAPAHGRGDREHRFEQKGGSDRGRVGHHRWFRQLHHRRQLGFVGHQPEVRGEDLAGQPCVRQACGQLLQRLKCQQLLERSHGLRGGHLRQPATGHEPDKSGNAPNDSSAGRGHLTRAPGHAAQQHGLPLQHLRGVLRGGSPAQQHVAPGAAGRQPPVPSGEGCREGRLPQLHGNR
mmetsp:Transcript_62234/g.112105  ORF Transcript_62234/g.112105 Transcript_62234/m.112105 type:complete len:233 (-) Transcript_62234:4750-5448(-)